MFRRIKPLGLLLAGFCLLPLAPVALAQDSFELRLSQAEAQLSISAQQALSMAQQLRVEAEAANNPYRTLDAMHIESNALTDLGEVDQAYALAELALTRARAIDDPLRQSDPLRRMANIHIDRNEYPEAEQRLFEAMRLIEGQQDDLRLAKTYGALARVRRYQVRYPEALAYADDALVLFQREEKERDTADLIAFRGVVMELMGQFEPALAAHTEALERLRRINDLSGVATALFNIAEIHRELGDHDMALAYLRDTLEMDQRTGNKLNIAYSYNMLGQSLTDQGDYDEARSHITQAITLFQELDAKRDTAWAQTMLGKNEIKAGNLDQAREVLEMALATALQRDSKSLIPIVRVYLVELEVLQGNFEKAVEHARLGIELTQQNNEKDREESLTGALADALEAAGDYQQAISALRRQSELRNELIKASRSQAFALMQSQAEFVRREQQIDLLEKDKLLQDARLERQQLIRYSWIFGLLAAFVVFALAFARYSQLRLNRGLSSEVAERTKALQHANEKLEAAYQAVEEASLTDQLTGLRNRRFLDQQLDADVLRCVRSYQDWQKGKSERPKDSDLVFFLIDFDHFKQVNDGYGHNAGDQLLRQVKDVLNSVFRESDYLVRWGGEEFLAVARFVEREDAAHIAERIRIAVSSQLFAVDKGTVLRRTVSIGFACLPFIPERPQLAGWKSVVDIADICLYAAKASGRNAWVGVEATVGIGESPQDLLVALRAEPEQLADSGRLRVLTSLPPSQKLAWS